MIPSSPPCPGALHDGSLTRAGSSNSAAALAFAASATGIAALGVDTLSGEHPSHTVTLALLVAAIVMARRWIAPRYRGLLHLLNAVVVSQPALHLAAKWVGHTPEHSAAEAPHGLLRSLLPGELALGQVALSFLIVVAVLAVGRLAEISAGFVDKRLRQLVRVPSPLTEGLVGPVRGPQRRSLLHQDPQRRPALRGPPHAVSPTN